MRVFHWTLGLAFTVAYVTEDEFLDLTGRGVRIDEGRPGHGLGLAIVQDIVGQYRGRLDFGRSPDLGGLRVVVELVAKV